MKDRSHLKPYKTPLIFTDGTEYFNKLGKDFNKHKKGFFIMAPSGSGKTHYINSQKKKDWIDGDELWETAGAHPKEAWWLMDGDTMDYLDARSDVITTEAKRQGFWVIRNAPWSLEESVKEKQQTPLTEKNIC
jgi:hypothetical protein